MEFSSRSGTLRVTREGDLFALDFPARVARPVDLSGALQAALGARPKEVLASRDLMAVYETEEEVRGLKPDLPLLSAYDTFAVLVTAPGKEADFVSRFFAPRQGIPEDPVTGSAHCTLVPYWARRLGKKKLHALQVSARGGELFCEDRGRARLHRGPGRPLPRGHDRGLARILHEAAGPLGVKDPFWPVEQGAPARNRTLHEEDQSDLMKSPD